MKKFDEMARLIPQYVLKVGGVKDADRHFRLKVFRETIELLGGIEGLGEKSVLDVGGGPASYTTWFASFSSNTLCFDLSMEMLRKGKERANLKNVQVEFVRGDGENLPFKTDSFDFVVGFAILHHVPNWKNCLHEMVRIAKKKVLVLEPNRASLPHLLNEVIYYFRPRFRGWKIVCEWKVNELHHLTPWEIRNEFKQSRLWGIHFKLTGFIPQCYPIPRILLRLLSYLENICEKIPLLRYVAGNVIVVGNKPPKNDV
jgi:SAM-dependent methyltransferase